MRGPDLEASELAAWLLAFERPLAILNCSSSSAPFLKKLSAKGRIVITATRQRTQEAHRRGALDRLTALIREAATPPKHRRPTKPSKAARQRRVDAKTWRGNIKKGRGRVGRDD